MARVTVEDCVDKVPNRFELVLLAAHRARALANGARMTVDPENDKNAVVALREFAERTVDPSDVREGVIHAMQTQVEVDEPEPTGVPTLPEVDRRALGSDDDPSTDTVVDAMTEEELLRRMRLLAPMDANTRGGGGVEGQGS
jgi:DNA-directed RNA polymerase subunit omega